MTITTEAHKDDNVQETMTVTRFHVVILYLALIHWSTVSVLKGRWNKTASELITYFRHRWPWLLDQQRRTND